MLKQIVEGNRRAILIFAIGMSSFLATVTPGQASPYGTVYDSAFKAMLQNPTDLDITFKFAMIARRAGDLEGAIGALERMLIYNRDLPIIYFELARLYAGLGSTEAAKRYYRSALRYKPPPRIRATIEAALTRLETDSKPSSFSGSIFSGFQYQTNAIFAPDDPQVKVRGNTARLADEFLAQSDVNGIISAQLTHRYDLGRDPAVFIVSELQLYGSRQRKFDRNDIDLFSATFGPAFSLTGNTVVRPFLRGDWILLDSATFYRSFGGGIRFNEARPGKSLSSYFVEAVLLHRDFRNSARSPLLDHRNGLIVSVRSGLRIKLTSSLTLNGFGKLEHKVGKAEYESFTGGNLGTTIVHRLPAPIGRRAWNVSVTGEAGIRHYAAPDPTVDPDNNREDTNIAIAFSLGIPLNHSFSFTVQVRQSWRMSNLPNFEFDNTSFLTGFLIHL
ncbi:MAG: tetratricopeptide repeat protein [Rhodospirillaceae bacterium]|nr:tetratricopeptide repeat protein [Rhodospirillaceae bacterium]